MVPKGVTIFLCILTGICLSLVIVNYYHASTCGLYTRQPDEQENFVEVLSERLTSLKKKIADNEVLMSKIIHSMEANLMPIGHAEYSTISKEAHTEAILLAQMLAKQPSPPMPYFVDDVMDTNMGKDVVDDIFNSKTDDKFNFNEIIEEYQEENGAKMTLTDAELHTLCAELQDKYGVIVSQSWGDLPYNLQQKWLEHACDYHLTEDQEEKEKGKEGAGDFSV